MPKLTRKPATPSASTPDTPKKRVGKLLGGKLNAAKEKSAPAAGKTKPAAETTPAPAAKASAVEVADIYQVKGLKFGKTKDRKPTVTLTDPAAPWDWDVPSLLAVNREILRRPDAVELAGKPRELLRQTVNALRSAGVKVADEPAEDTKASKPAKEAKLPERAKARNATMPLDIDLDKQGIPLTSPVVGRPDAGYDVDHIERSEWDTKNPKMLRLHKEAESFRRARVESKQWDCTGINCHDCVEHFRSMEPIADQCMPHSLKLAKKSGIKFPYVLPKDSDKLNAELKGRK